MCTHYIYFIYVYNKYSMYIYIYASVKMHR